MGRLATALTGPCFPSNRTWNARKGLAEYAANIGLFASRSKGSAQEVAAQNVLPERHAPRGVPVAAYGAVSQTRSKTARAST